MVTPAQRSADEPRRFPRGLRLVVIGGSTAAGLGTRGRSFATLVIEELKDAHVLDLSLTGRMLDEHILLADQIREFAPDLTIICAGVSESMVHPGPRAQRAIERYAPASWHGVSGLQARPYYSEKRFKRLRQRAVSEIKVGVKRTVIKLTKGRSRMPAEDLGRNLEALLALFDELHCPTIVLDLWHTDERLFPGTNRAFQAASAAVIPVVERSNVGSLLDLRDALLYWDDFLDDHLHWNARGHRHVADLVLERMTVLVTSPSAEPGEDNVSAEADALHRPPIPLQ